MSAFSPYFTLWSSATFSSASTSFCRLTSSISSARSFFDVSTKMKYAIMKTIRSANTTCRSSP